MGKITCQMQPGVDGAEFTVGHIFVFAGEKTPDDWPCQCGMVRYSENSLEELTQSKARIEQLENHIGEMGSMLKFNEMTARIRELEDAIRKFLEADMELDDKLNHPIGVEISPNLYQAVKKAKRGLLDIMPLSEKSDKEK